MDPRPHRSPLGPADPADPAFGAVLESLTVERLLTGAEVVDPGPSSPTDPASRVTTAARSGRILRAVLGGTGETYAAWRVDPEHGEPFAIRVLRRTDTPPRAMRDEVAAMSLVPADVGTTALAFDADCTGALGRPFVAQSWVPGRTVPVDEWDDGLLGALARTAAQLHGAVPSTGHGPVTGDASARAPFHDLLGELRSARGWWTENHPEIAATPALGALGDRVEAYVAARTLDADGRVVPSPLGTALIHGDLVAVNIAVEDTLDGPRCWLLDWEWAEYSDPAKDLALIGGTIAAAPWYATLDDERRRRFVAAYLEAAGRPLSVLTAVLERCNAWQAYDRYTMLCYCRSRALSRNDPEGIYARSAEKLRAGLDAALP